MMPIKRYMSEEGSLLLSTFHLLLFISFLILSVTGVVYNQLMQLQQISQSYEAKALIEVSESMLKDRLVWEDVETATLYFSQGHVEILKETDAEYSLVAYLNNRYTSRQRFIVEPDPTLEEILIIQGDPDPADVPLADENSSTGGTGESSGGVEEKETLTGNE
ncbi:hypothetical protein SAMN04488100_10833 [Alkalibacterium putridalgicola]|uniref:Competence protein ComGG n=2 Tax=Alkalibacterium putridalgicola TaxID=426703 RepID=A0A1H7SGS7_9LACT|nr:hypothetical protein APU01nite_07940 [Alkalibacterium putridalgicola]SEL71618.1 hypothetical protein SAMN04488100_10833 [Alkalibacterium putridalgicola]